MQEEESIFTPQMSKPFKKVGVISCNSWFDSFKYNHYYFTLYDENWNSKMEFANSAYSHMSMNAAKDMQKEIDNDIMKILEAQ